MPQNKTKSRPRGKVPRLDESGNKRNNELGRSTNILEMGSSRQKKTIIEVDEDGNRLLTVRHDQWVPSKRNRH